MIYCFDLDGTLCSQQDLDYENALPFVKRVKHVNDLYDDGHTIIIDTARGSGATKGKDWTEITEKQLVKVRTFLALAQQVSRTNFFRLILQTKILVSVFMKKFVIWTLTFASTTQALIL